MDTPLAGIDLKMLEKSGSLSKGRATRGNESPVKGFNQIEEHPWESDELNLMDQYLLNEL